jgi:hypothetical protein
MLKGVRAVSAESAQSSVVMGNGSKEDGDTKDGGRGGDRVQAEATSLGSRDLAPLGRTVACLTSFAYVQTPVSSRARCIRRR